MKITDLIKIKVCIQKWEKKNNDRKKDRDERRSKQVYGETTNNNDNNLFLSLRVIITLYTDK